MSVRDREKVREKVEKVREKVVFLERFVRSKICPVWLKCPWSVGVNERERERKSLFFFSLFFLRDGKFLSVCVSSFPLFPCLCLFSVLCVFVADTNVLQTVGNCWPKRMKNECLWQDILLHLEFSRRTHFFTNFSKNWGTLIFGMSQM